MGNAPIIHLFLNAPLNMSKQLKGRTENLGKGREEDGNIVLTKKFVRVFLYNVMENPEQTFCEPNRKG